MAARTGRPVDRWPNGWGFDYFYGILGGEPGQWDTVLAENQKVIGVPPDYADPDDPFYFPDDVADKTIEWLHGVRAQEADKPFFVYFSTGCAHAPHHVAESWRPSTRASSTKGGTGCARRPLPARRPSVSSRRTRS